MKRTILSSVIATVVTLTVIGVGAYFLGLFERNDDPLDDKRIENLVEETKDLRDAVRALATE